jgi:hypothetical protein
MFWLLIAALIAVSHAAATGEDIKHVAIIG